jgi:TRAP-type uncharacterized transport system substrate-binding protein
MVLTIPQVIRQPVVMRSRLMLEVASELVAADEWRDKQVTISFRPQGDESWRIRFFASDAPNSVDAIVNGEADVAICNPGGVLAMALKGAGPYKQPIPLRSIMVLPQFDQFGFAVKKDTGITSLADLRDKKYPLRVSLRGQRDHSVHMIASQVLATYGMTFDDINAWDGQVRYDAEFPNGPNRIGAVERGEIDAIFDEAMPMFADRALELGMRFLPVDEPQLQQLEGMGLRRVAITKDEFPGMPEDVWTVDFSGWPVFCLESAPDELVGAFCAGLEGRRERIPWYGDGPMRLDLMCKDTREGPMLIPLHRAAEAFWREQGYL